MNNTPTPTAPVAPTIDSGTFKQAIQWASQNPSTPQAQELQSRITAGKYNTTITQMGLKPEQFGYKAPAPTVTPNSGVNAGLDPAGSLIPSISKLPGDFENRAKNIISDVQNAPQVAKDAGGGVVPTVATALSTTGHIAGQVAGATGDILNRVIFSPVINAVPGLKEKLQSVGDSFMNAVNPLGEKNSDTIAKMAKVLDQYPELAKSLGDVVNTTSLLGGAKAEPVVKEGLTQIPKAIDTAIPKIESSVGGLVDKVNPLAVTPEKQIKAVNNLESDYEKWAGSTKSGVKNLGKSEAKTSALNEAGTTGKTPARTLAEAGIVPETEGTKFRTLDQANNFRDSITPLDDALTNALDEVKTQTPPIKIDDWVSKSLAQAKGVSMPEGERVSLQNEIKSEGQLLKDKYGDTIDISSLNKEKQAYSKGVKFDSSKPFKSDAYYNLRKGAQTLIEDTANQAGLTDVAQLNREIGDRLSAADFLQTLDGQTLKVGKVGKYALIMTGATLGTGFVGKLLGAAGGEVLGNVLMKADVANPVKRMILRSIEQKSPEAYQQVLEWAKQQGVDRELRLALPAAGQSSAPIEMQSPGILEGQQKLRDQSLPSNLDTNTTIKNTANDSNISDTNTIKSKNTQGGFIDPAKIIEDVSSGVSKAVQKLMHPEDITFLKNGINYFRGTSEIAPNDFDRLHEMLVKLGIKVDQTHGKIASDIENFLQGKAVPSWLKKKK